MTAVNEDLIDRVLAEWHKEKPELNASALGVVGRVIHLADGYRKHINRELDAFDLQYSEFDVLATLRRSGKPYQLTPTQLIQSVLLTSGAITAATNRLEKKKLVRRVPDPNDGRVKSVALTKAAIALVDKAVIRRFEVADTGIERLNKKETAQLERLLRKLSL
jgi:DNA-binding MarR family transcriptional regulator